MSVHRNNKAVASIFRGEQPIGKAYRGDRLVFAKGGGGEWDGLTFTAVEDGSSVKYTATPYETTEYSYDTKTWKTANDIVISLNIGDKVYFRSLMYGDKSKDRYSFFSMTGKIAASGNIQTMVDIVGESNAVKSYAFYKFFKDCKSLVSAPNLPALKLGGNCYELMFSGCTSLVQAPELPATTLNYYCYDQMFLGCTSLVQAPELPATTLVNYCYDQMFSGCTSLVQAPELPATTLVNYCYDQMFSGCTKISCVKIHATYISASKSLYYWLSGAPTSGTFYKKAGVSYPSGASGIPSGWTVVEF